MQHDQKKTIAPNFRTFVRLYCIWITRSQLWILQFGLVTVWPGWLRQLAQSPQLPLSGKWRGRGGESSGGPRSGARPGAGFPRPLSVSAAMWYILWLAGPDSLITWLPQFEIYSHRSGHIQLEFKLYCFTPYWLMNRGLWEVMINRHWWVPTKEVGWWW